MKTVFGLFIMLFVLTAVTSSCKSNKHSQKRSYSSSHSWKAVSIGRTCNKKKRKH